MEVALSNLNKTLNKILDELEYKDRHVRIVPVSSGGANYTTALFEITVTNPGKPTLELFAKAATFSDAMREQMGEISLYHTEHLVYEILAKKFAEIEDKHNVPLEDRYVFPKYYGSNVTRGEEVFIMENLTKQRFHVLDRFKVLDWEHASVSIKDLAKFHALSMALQKEYPEVYEHLKSEHSLLLESYFGVLLALAYKYIKVLDPKYHDKLLSFFDNYNQTVELVRNPVGKSVLIHTDYRTSNILYKRKGAKLTSVPVDYQGIREGNPFFDFHYFLVTASDEKFRKHHYDRMLDLFYTEIGLALKKLGLDIGNEYPRKQFDADHKALEKLRSQVTAQESAASETEKEVTSRRSALQSQQQQVEELQQQLQQLLRQQDQLTDSCSRSVLKQGQEEVKSPEADFSAMNGSGFASDPFKDNSFSNDPFAPNNKSSSGFASDPFAPSSGNDPFAGDSFANSNSTTMKNDTAWESDPFAVLHAPTRGSNPPAASPSPAPSKHKTPPPRPAPPRPAPANKTRANSSMDFTEDPFKDYRYEDPFNIEDPFADVTDSKKIDPFAARPTSVAGFETDDFFPTTINLNNGFAPPDKRSGRVSAPPVAYDPFGASSNHKSTPNVSTNNDSWAAWPNDDWAKEDAWSKPSNNKTTDAWPKSSHEKSDTWNTTSNSNSDAWNDSSKNTNSLSKDWKTDNWANKTDNWANKTDNWAEWGSDQNKNLNETWPTNTLPAKKEKSPKPVKYARSLVHTIGGIGRSKHGKDKRSHHSGKPEDLPSEEKQWAWAAAESRRLQDEAERARQKEDAELQLALALSRQEK